MHWFFILLAVIVVYRLLTQVSEIHEAVTHTQARRRELRQAARAARHAARAARWARIRQEPIWCNRHPCVMFAIVAVAPLCLLGFFWLRTLLHPLP